MQGSDDGNQWQAGRLPQLSQQRQIIHSDHSANMIMHQMQKYWEDLRRDNPVPLRSDVSPNQIPHLLDNAFLLERLAPGTARFRLSGRHLMEVAGTEIRGMLLAMVMKQPSRAALSTVLETVFNTPQIARLSLSSKPQARRPELAGHMLLLPLRSDLGDVSRILGCLVTQGDLGFAPRRFDLARAEFTPVVPGGKVVKPELPKSPLSRSTPTPSGTMSSPAVQPNPEARRAGFRVIPGGKVE